MLTNSRKNRLRHDAIPTLFSVPNPPQRVGMQRRQLIRHNTTTTLPGNYSVTVINM